MVAWLWSKYTVNDLCHCQKMDECTLSQHSGEITIRKNSTLHLFLQSQCDTYVQVRTRSPGLSIWRWRTSSCCVQMEPRRLWMSMSNATWQRSQPTPLWCAWRISAASGNTWSVCRWVWTSIAVCVQEVSIHPRLCQLKTVILFWKCVGCEEEFSASAQRADASTPMQTSMHALSAVMVHPSPAECVWQCRGGLQLVQLSRLRPSGSALQRCHPPPAESSRKLHLLAGPHLYHHAASLRVWG